ncbi:MAG: hypothetical protein R2939_18415 [Kofleriaceae bacterium]
MTRRRALALAAVWLLPSALLLGAAASVQRSFQIDVPPALDADARRAVVAPLRSLVAAEVPAPLSPQLAARRLPGRGPLVATVWVDGKAVARAVGHGDTLAAATLDAAGSLAKALPQARLDGLRRARARIKVDLVVGRAPLAQGNWLSDHLAFAPLADALALVPGLEGLGASGRGQELLLLPEQLVDEKLLGKQRPLAMFPEWQVGLDGERADALLARQAGIRRTRGEPSPWSYFRFRVDAFVEPPTAERLAGEAPLPVVRGTPPGPAVDAPTLRAAALAGGRYLVGHLSPSGRYIYEHNLATDRKTNPEVGGAYSIPRHAGTTYFLAELYRITGEEFLREPIERAFSHLDELVEQGGCTGRLADGQPFACVADRGQQVAALGSTALGVVALAEYERATGDARYRPLAERLTAWVLMMQRPDGSFRHEYDIASHTPDERKHLPYYAGEAALALARMHTVTGEARYLAAAGRALDHLVSIYDHFLGGFFYFEEHWTCIAAEAVLPGLRPTRYRDFCDGYGAFLRGQQVTPTSPGRGDLAGAYVVAPFVVPFTTPAGSMTEAMLSAWLLGEAHGGGDPAIWGQIEAALGFVLRQQIRPANAWAVAADDGLGGVPGSPTDRIVRIDYVQHVCSAMIRAAEILERRP